MKCVVVASIGLFAALWFGTGRADAMAELCPATITALVPSASIPAEAASNVFTYKLIAGTKRTIDTATIIADTDHGWYRWNVAAIALTPASLQVSFPESLTIHHAWIENANATTCPVPTYAARDASAPERATAAAAAIAQPASPVEPAANARAVAQPFGTIGCAEPFRNATIKATLYPQIPPGVRGTIPSAVTVKVDVLLDESGKLLDASIYSGTANMLLDQSVLRAVRSSQFSGAVSYCQNVPSEYLLSETLGPF